MNPHSSSLSARLSVTLGVTVSVLLMLAGCASPPNVQATKEALEEVSEETQVTEEEFAEEYPEINVEVEPLKCTPYLVITARGTGEPSKGQLLSPVARAISDARPDDVTTLDLDYPATTEMKDGATLGIYTLIKTLNVQSEACPEQKFVLLGYSQGALIVGDAVASPDVRLIGEHAEELLPHASDQVAAIVMYGDPRFVGSEPFNIGLYRITVNGLLARPEGALDTYVDRIRDYCVLHDFVCQSSLDLDEEGHVEYFKNGMQDDGAEFVISRLDPIPKKVNDKDSRALRSSESEGEQTP